MCGPIYLEGKQRRRGQSSIKCVIINVRCRAENKVPKLTKTAKHSTRHAVKLNSRSNHRILPNKGISAWSFRINQNVTRPRCTHRKQPEGLFGTRGIPQINEIRRLRSARDRKAEESESACGSADCCNVELKHGAIISRLSGDELKHLIYASGRP